MPCVCATLCFPTAGTDAAPAAHPTTPGVPFRKLPIDDAPETTFTVGPLSQAGGDSRKCATLSAQRAGQRLCQHVLQLTVFMWTAHTTKATSPAPQRLHLLFCSLCTICPLHTPPANNRWTAQQLQTSSASSCTLPLGRGRTLRPSLRAGTARRKASSKLSRDT